MSVKLTTPGFLKINPFRNKSYDVIIPDYYVTNTILSRHSNHIVDVVMWSKFGNSSISVREVIITSILYGWPEKTFFLRDDLGSSSIIWDQCGKRVKIKSQKVFGAKS